MKYNIDELKEQYIGQTFNWLTVLDVYKEKDKQNHTRTYFKCQCKCGNIISDLLQYVIKGRKKSCGCYIHSKEHAMHQSKLMVDWCKNNYDKMIDSRMNSSKYWKKHPEELTARGDKISDWCKHNEDKVKTRNKNISTSNTKYAKNKRINCNFTKIENFVHTDYINLLYTGNLKAHDKIMTKCPMCNNYAEHLLCNVFKISNSSLRYKDNVPLCHDCFCKQMSSHYEDEIINFIKSFYNGEVIRNTRDIINPLELDIYIPDKNIAIEFNGDYWHNEDHKDKLYHFNKFKLCKESNILLASIFESEWNNRKDEIKEYLKDSFNGKENKLSFSENKTLMNNNYPCINKYNFDSHIVEDYYIYQNKKIYTCGYSKFV